MEAKQSVVRRRELPEGFALRREVGAVLEEWIEEVEDFTRAAARLQTVAQLPSVGQVASAEHLNELESVSGQLAAASVAFERESAKWPAAVRESTQVSDVRSSIARSRAMLERARLFLEAKGKMG